MGGTGGDEVMTKAGDDPTCLHLESIPNASIESKELAIVLWIALSRMQYNERRGRQPLELLREIVKLVVPADFSGP